MDAATIRRCKLCTKPLTKRHQRTYCSRHCALRGSPPTGKPIEARFWAKVDRNGPVPDHQPELGACWIWTGSKNGHGYAQFCTDRARGLKMVKAHRLCWELVNGPIPSGHGFHGTCVCHRCDNRACVNPTHLFLGTTLDNVRDMIAKGRRKQAPWNGISPSPNPGESNPMSRLTESDVLKIRVLRSEGVQLKTLSELFHVSEATCSLISRRKTWKHI